MNRQQITAIIRLVLSVSLLGLLFAIIDRQTLLQMFAQMDVRYYLIALGFYVFTLFLWAWRWLLIIRASGDEASLWRAFMITIIGNFFSMFLPSMVGTDLARMYELSHEGHSRSKSVSSVLLDRLFGLSSLIIVALIALIFGYRYVADQKVDVVILVLAVGLALGWVMFFNRTFMHHFRPILRLPIISQFEDKFSRLYYRLHDLHNQPHLIISAMAVSIVLQCVEIVSMIFIALALNLQIAPVYFFILMPLIWVITTIPISINGIGVREGAFVALFGWVGVPASEAIAMSLLAYSLRVVTGVLGGLIFLRLSLTAPKKLDNPTSPEPLMMEAKTIPETL